MFQTSVIRCPIKLKVAEVARNVREVVEARAKKMLEGICSYVGYAKPGSLRLLQMGPGVLSGIDMGRHFTFQCTFAAEVCNPAPGTRMKAYVRSVNRFGALVEGGYIDHMGTLVPVIELVVIRDPTIAKNEVDVADLAPGDEVGVEVLGRRFELRDTRIAGYGRTVLEVGGSEVAPGISTAPDGAGTGAGMSSAKGDTIDYSVPGSEGASGAAEAKSAIGAKGAAATLPFGPGNPPSAAADESAADGESDGASEDGVESGSDGGSDGADEDEDSDIGGGVDGDGDDDDDLVSWAEEDDPVAPDDDAGDAGDAGDGGEIADDGIAEADDAPVGIGRR